MTEDNQDVTFRKHSKDDPHFFIEQTFKNTCRNKSLSDDKLKVLKDELGKDIVVQVEEADRRKPILLVGSNDALVKGTLALIWNTHPLIPKVKLLLGSGNDRVYFVDKNCSGLTEDEIRKDLFYLPEKRPDENDLAEVMHQRTLFKRKMSECLKPLMNLYNNLCILSLRRLEGKQHENILKRIIAEVEERKGNNEEGCLIVSIDGTDNLPEDLKDQFEPIYLEPEKQGRSVSVQQTKAENVFRWCGGTWEITFDGKTIRPPDSFGLKYIHYLLKHPDKEIYVTELRLITGTQLRERSNKSYDEEKKDNEESSGIESGDKMNKILDSTSIEEIKRAIGYLSEQSVGAEEGEKAELLDKKTLLELYLKKATNINADSRDFSTDLEKARKAVSKCITNSLEIIKKEHTTLEQYLSTTIKMGNVFQYKHTSKIDWQLS